mmetsp:Transcript_15590/g.22612  ORF Transcript_15590/g.22612 Transcript_15590/m.22612 type:complete len:80 (+) Transcript_15590:383-622(+)
MMQKVLLFGLVWFGFCLGFPLWSKLSCESPQCYSVMPNKNKSPFLVLVLFFVLFLQWVFTNTKMIILRVLTLDRKMDDQ